MLRFVWPFEDESSILDIGVSDFDVFDLLVSIRALSSPGAKETEMVGVNDCGSNPRTSGEALKILASNTQLFFVLARHQ